MPTGCPAALSGALVSFRAGLVALAAAPVGGVRLDGGGGGGALAAAAEAHPEEACYQCRFEGSLTSMLVSLASVIAHRGVPITGVAKNLCHHCTAEL